MLVAQAFAHEVLPSIADMEQTDDGLVFDVELNLESFIAGIDQSVFADTNEADQAADYDALRALEPDALEDAFRQYWPAMAQGINVSVDGQRQDLSLTGVEVGSVGNFDLPRDSKVQFVATLPDRAETVQFNWVPQFGAIALRQVGVPSPYEDYLTAGSASPEISLSGGFETTGWQTFLKYIPVGVDHIVPKGLDHILFVLGLFFLSTRMGPLLWQISTFTVAHTITLALAATGYVDLGRIITLPGGSEIELIAIVEALIAASIVYVAIENLFTDGLSRSRPFVIFGFGLLHGLGFASVLADFGLPDGTFIPALIGFNIGVEVGQLAVVAVAFIIVRKAIEFEQTGDSSRSIAAIYLCGMVAVMALLIPAARWVDPVETSIVIVTAAILFGLSAASVVVGRFDSYREIVAMPASILIAVVAVYWCFERVFL